MKFARWVVFTFAVHVFVILLDKGAGLVVYKIFEDRPDEKGAADLLTTLPFIMMAVANLGLATSTVFFLRKKTFTIKQLSQTTSLVAVVWGGLISVVAILVIQFVLPQIQESWAPRWTWVVPICLCVPFLLTTSYFNSIQLAVERVRDYNLVHLVASLLFLPLFLLYFFGTGAHVAETVAWTRLTGAIVVTTVTLFSLRHIVRWRPRMHWEVLRASVGYGWKANLVGVLTYLNHRLDLYLVGFLFLAGGALLGPDALREVKLNQVAFYSLAVTFAELVWHFPEATRDLFFSKVAGSTHQEARRFTPPMSRLCFAAAVLASVIIYFAVDPAMAIISPEKWSEKWRTTVMACVAALIPGTVAYTVAKILQNDLAARGHLNHCIAASGMVLATMVGLDMLWIPEYGALGAAWASTIAYLVSSIYTLLAYSRCGGANPMQCLVPRPSDILYVRMLGAAVGEKIWGRQP